MVVVDTVVRVSDAKGVREALRLAQAKPIYAIVARELLDDFLARAREEMLLYRTVGEEGEGVKLLVMAPELLFRLDRDVGVKSGWLADPDVLATAIKEFPLASVEEVETPEDLVRFAAEGCRSHHNLLVFISKAGWGHAFVVCVNEVVLAAVFAGERLSYGAEAIRRLLYGGPYVALRYVIDLRALGG